MASNQKVGENRPHLKFNFTYWEGFSACIHLCINLPLLALGGGAAAECSTGAEQLYITSTFNRFLTPFFNVQTGLKTPPSR